MDFEISGAASVLEIAALYPRSQYLSWPVLKSLLGLLLLHYAVIKCYRMFIYPYWFSPLRHLPGPKVRCPATYRRSASPAVRC